MKRSIHLGCLMAAMTLSPVLQLAHAAYSFTEWNTKETAAVHGSLDGVGVHFSGQVAGSTQVQNQGTQYWTEYDNHPRPYTPITGTLPTRSDIVAMATVGTFSITFDQPVANPVMLLCSLGSPGVVITYSFDQAAKVLTSGYSWWNHNNWGGLGWLAQGSDERTVKGWEGCGVIAFEGLVTQITWTTDAPEYWHGVTLAAGDDWHSIWNGVVPQPGTWPDPGTPVPEPVTLVAGALLLLPLGLRFFRRRN